MGSVLRSFGAFQRNIWSVTPFFPVGPGENQCCPHKMRIFSKSPNGPIFNFFLVVQNIVFDIIHSKIRPNNFFPYIRILTSCGENHIQSPITSRTSIPENFSSAGRGHHEKTSIRLDRKTRNEDSFLWFVFLTRINSICEFWKLYF